MLEPYDGTQERGMELMPAAEIHRLVALSLAGRISVAIHAIGDRACRSALDAFEEAGPDLRAGVRLAPRIEHVQLVSPPDLDRFARLGVAASMQPVHCTSDLPLVERWWRSRAANAYPWRALRERGALLAFGSDAPVEHPGVAEGLHAAVTRERADGTPPGGFVPTQRLDLDAALTAYTEAPARLAGSWPRLGRIAAGATADLVVWNADLHALPASALREAAPALVVLDGDVAFEAASEPLRAAAGGQS
jgi:predicted amidohydrolase YtcJ